MELYSAIVQSTLFALCNSKTIDNTTLWIAMIEIWDYPTEVRQVRQIYWFAQTRIESHSLHKHPGKPKDVDRFQKADTFCTWKHSFFIVSFGLKLKPHGSLLT